VNGQQLYPELGPIIRILLLGKNGKVGWELLRTLGVFVEGDLSNPGSLRGTVCAVSPQVIVNTGAYTATHKTESEHDMAHIVFSNCTGA